MAADTHILQSLGGFNFKLEHSAGLDARAREVGEVVSSGLQALSNVLGFSPSLRLLVLSREDWPHFTANPTFGMTHCPDGQTIITSADPPDFWDGARSWVFKTVDEAAMEHLAQVYGTVDGEVDVRPFHDLFALHELGHIFHRQVPFDFPRGWLRELFANLCQYTAVVEGLPERMPQLLALPRAVQRTSDGIPHTSLDDLDLTADEMGLGNFVWYQWQLLFSARAIYERDGSTVLRRLFDASLQCCDRPLPDGDLLAWLDRKAGPTIGGVMRNWPHVS